MNTRKRFVHIDLIETIAIIFVVFVHCPLYKLDILEIGLDGVSVALRYCRYFIRTIFSTCVPLFFFANGYLLFSKPYNNQKHIKRTVKICALPLFGLVLHPVYMLIAGREVSWKLVVTDLLNLTTQWTMNVFWFAGALSCIYFLFPALKALYDKDYKVFVGTTIIIFSSTFIVKLGNVLLALINVVVDIPLHNLNYPLIEMYIPFKSFGFTFVYFCLGGIMFKHEDAIRITNARKRNLSALLITITDCLLLFVTGVLYSKYVSGSLWDVVWDGYDTVPTLMNVIAIYLFSLNVSDTFCGNRIIECISKNTLGVYLLHYLIIRITRPYFQSSIFCNIPVNFLYAILVTITCVIIIEGTKTAAKRLHATKLK